MRTGLALYQALRSVDVPDDKAMAVIEALGTETQARLAKVEPEKLRYSIKADSDRFARSFTINLFLMLTSYVVIVLSAFSCMH